MIAATARWAATAFRFVRTPPLALSNDPNLLIAPAPQRTSPADTVNILPRTNQNICRWRTERSERTADVIAAVNNDANISIPRPRSDASTHVRLAAARKKTRRTGTLVHGPRFNRKAGTETTSAGRK
jgi:hypothetical protein